MKIRRKGTPKGVPADKSDKVLIFPGTNKSKGRRLNLEIRNLLNRELLLLVVLGVFLGRATFLGTFSPFAIGFFAIILAEKPERAFPVSLAVMAGLLTAYGLPEASPYVIVIPFLAILEGLLPRRPRGEPVASQRQVTGWRELLLVLGTLLVVKLPFVYFFGVLPHDMFTAVAEAGTNVLFYLLSANAAAAFFSQSTAHKAGPDAGFALALALGGTIAGMTGLKIASVDPAIFVATAVIQMVALYAGAGVAAGSGVLTGFLISFSGQYRSPELIALFGLGGLLSGFLGRGNKLLAGTAFGATVLLLTPYLGTEMVPLDLIREIALGTVLFLAVPETWWQSFLLGLRPTRFASPNPVEREISPDNGGEDNRRIWKAFSLEEYLQSSGDPKNVAVKRLQEFAGVFRELARSFDQVQGATRLTRPEENLGQILNTLTQRVCHRCSSRRKCWDQEFLQTYQKILDSLTRIELKGSQVRGKGVESLRWCANQEELVGQASHLLEIHRLNSQWEKKLTDSREIVSAQLRGVSQIMENLAVEVATVAAPPVRIGPVARRKRYRPLKVKTGVARVARKGRVVSGDSFLSKELAGDKYILVLSDGMGAGSRAAMESKTAVSLLEELLESGFEVEVAVRTVNSVLLLRSPEEIFATIDLLVVDLNTGDAQFIKIGASPSFLKRGNEVMTIRSSTLPLGILHNIEIETSQKLLKPKDLVIMVSDGLLEAGPNPDRREEWLAGFLRKTTVTDPQKLAEALLAEGCKAGREVGDDMTVLVVGVTSREDFRN